ncbi:hypothetical protein ABEX33_03035, partial [Brevibacillus agri]
RKRTHARGTHRRGRHEQRLLHTIPDKLKPEELQELKIWLAEDPHLERLYFALQDIRTVYAVLKPKRQGRKRFRNGLSTISILRLLRFVPLPKRLSSGKSPFRIIFPFG